VGGRLYNIITLQYTYVICMCRVCCACVQAYSPTCHKYICLITPILCSYIILIAYILLKLYNILQIIKVYTSSICSIICNANAILHCISSTLQVFTLHRDIHIIAGELLYSDGSVSKKKKNQKREALYRHCRRRGILKYMYSGVRLGIILYRLYRH